MVKSLIAPRLAAFWPYTPTRLDDVARWSSLVTAGAFQRLWLGQSAVIDTSAAISYAAGAGRSCPVGVAVQVIPMHHPATAAQQIRALAASSTQPVRVCFSPGDARAQTVFTGRRWASPLTATREFLTVVRALLRGEALDQCGDYYSLRGQLPFPATEAHLGLGVLRPRMARLAGELADTAVTWLAPPAYVRDVIVPELDAGAASAERVRPELVVPVHAAVAAPGRDARQIAQSAVGHHLQGDTYRAMLDLAGERSALEDGADGALASGLMTYGSIDDIAARVAEVAACGADEIPLVLHHPIREWDDALEEWLEVGHGVATRLATLLGPRDGVKGADVPALEAGVST